MGTMQNPVDDATPQKASEWLIALQESPSDAVLRKRFDAWLAASLDHATDWAEITHTVEALRRLESVDRQASRKEEPCDLGLAKPRNVDHRRSRRRLAAGLAVAIAASVAILIGPNIALRLQADQVTGTAEQKTVRLVDGSMIRLAPESAIQVIESTDTRRVRLLRGEAFFEVVHDGTRPFTVEASGVRTTDLGTAFDIRQREDGTDVAVQEGLVRVEASGVATEKLATGEWIRVRDGQTQRGRVSREEVGSWMHGQLVAKSRPVAEIVDALRPYYAGVIILRDVTLANQTLTGVYNLSDPEAALRAVAEAQGARVRRISPWILVLSGH